MDTTTTDNSSSQPQWIAIIAMIAVVLGAGYYYGSPYMTLYKSGQAFEEGDSEYICERIDFEQLGDNLDEGMPPETPMMMRGLVESGLDCATIESAMDLAEMLDAGDEDDGDDDGGLFEALGDDAEAGFDGLTTFEIVLGEEEERQTRLVLERTMTSWQLTDIQFIGD